MSVSNANTNDALATALTQSFIDGGHISEDQRDNLHSACMRVLNAQPPQKEQKVRQPRKLTGYNVFVKENNAIIRSEMGDAAKKRGASMKECAIHWKALTDEERAEFKVRAAAMPPSKTKKTRTKKTPAVALPDVDPISLDELTEGFPDTYARGVVKGSKQYATLDEARVGMAQFPQAAAICQLSEGKFKLRAGHQHKKKRNQTSNGTPTPPFVYLAPLGDDQMTWARLTAIDAYDVENPFTKDNPFNPLAQDMDGYSNADVATDESVALSDSVMNDVFESQADEDTSQFDDMLDGVLAVASTESDQGANDSDVAAGAESDQGANDSDVAAGAKSDQGANDSDADEAPTQSSESSSDEDSDSDNGAPDWVAQKFYKSLEKCVMNGNTYWVHKETGSLFTRTKSEASGKKRGVSASDYTGQEMTEDHSDVTDVPELHEHVQQQLN